MTHSGMHIQHVCIILCHACSHMELSSFSPLTSGHCAGSLERLSQMFELPLKEVHSVVSRMVIKEELLVSDE